MEVLGRARRVVQRHRGCAAPARNTARLDANDAPRAAEERLAVCALQAVDRAGRVVHRSTRYQRREHREAAAHHKEVL